ncbi:hypothetical protein DSUL_20537 [Desulfovibrionales bacterium]
MLSYFPFSKIIRQSTSNIIRSLDTGALEKFFLQLSLRLDLLLAGSVDSGYQSLVAVAYESYNIILSAVDSVIYVYYTHIGDALSLISVLQTNLSPASSTS